jgi:collagen beta-1,O-galactosyltransferase
MINLARRDDRRLKMENVFQELGLVVEHFAAVDGRLLNEDTLKELGIEFLPGYYDPYHKRPMTMGEIGCFLSHYHIWEKVSYSGSILKISLNVNVL